MTWIPIWRDDFDGLTLAPHWIPSVGRRTADGELEFLRAENTSLRNRCLVLTAKREDYQGAAYTSAMVSLDPAIVDFKAPCAFEYRALCPTTVGVHSACWEVGDPPGGWPADGEVDSEMLGRKPGGVWVAVHGQTVGGAHWSRGVWVTVPGGIGVWHTYRREYWRDHIDWFIDGVWVWTLRETELTPDQLWVFEEYEYKPVLSLFVGGNFAGPPAATGFPCEFLVDTVQVDQWQEEPMPEPTPVSDVQCQILSPNAMTNYANPVTVSLTVTGTSIRTGEGSSHLHLRLDGVFKGHVYNLKPFALPDLSPGQHQLDVTVVQNDAAHTPWPGAVAVTTFQVGGIVLPDVRTRAKQKLLDLGLTSEEAEATVNL